MQAPHWESEFRSVHARAVSAWSAGLRSPNTLLSPKDTSFLNSIGCSTHELFDFVEDLQAFGEPDLETVLDVQRVRYDYFNRIQAGIASTQIASMDALPPKSAAADGIPWLPRLIAKARLKLQGEMPHELMYGCGGDRPFASRMRITLGDFLRLVWECGRDDQKIIDALKKNAGMHH